MQIVLENPDYAYVVRGADGASATVNDRVLDRSFIVAPDALVEEWQVHDITTMQPADLEPMFTLKPELIVLGCGNVQRFPPAAVMAACLTRGIGIETMTNAAAARTYNVLAGEGRRVAMGFVIASLGGGSSEGI